MASHFHVKMWTLSVPSTVSYYNHRLPNILAGSWRSQGNTNLVAQCFNENLQFHIQCSFHWIFQSLKTKCHPTVVFVSNQKEKRPECQLLFSRNNKKRRLILGFSIWLLVTSLSNGKNTKVLLLHESKIDHPQTYYQT